MSKYVLSEGSVTVDRFVSLADGDMHVMEDGQADAPALLLIHGSGGSTLWWDPVVAGLAEVFRVVRVDLLGHGSSASPTGGYDIPTHARRVGTALDELGVGRVTVVGHSMGCLVATALAEQRPHQTAALVLIDMGPSLDAAAPDGLLVRLLLARFPGPLLWRLRSEATIRRALRSAFARPVEVPYAIVGAALGMTHRALAGTARGAVDYINHQSLPDRLVALGVPLLVIFGQEDARYSSSSAADYRTVPGARIEVLAGVGHTPMLEDPQTTARLLRELTTTPVRPTVMETQRDVLGGALVDEVCDEGLAMTDTQTTASLASRPLGKLRRPRYGVDAAPLLAVLASAAGACLVSAARWRNGRIATATAGAVLLASTGSFLHTTLRGKLRIWERELDRAGLAGDEHLLDMGCGRGAVLIEAAKRLPAGRVVGVDLWSRDQSGNSPQATLANAVAAGVADRVEVHTADMTALPFPDGSFDVVTSALAIHNIDSLEGRYRALDEAMRVLRPGGQVLIADISPMTNKYAAYLGHGSLRNLGPGYWYGGPWFGVSLLHLTKEKL